MKMAAKYLSNKNTNTKIISHVGNKLRQLRLSHGMSLSEVAEHLGISFQQFQKYERGINRITVDKLFIIAEFFRIDIRYFFYDNSHE